MNLADIKTIKKLIDSEDFSFKKSLGQNFLINDSVCPKMAESCCGADSGVLEIGPGIGVLTAELAKRAKKVVSIELDSRLQKILTQTLDGFNNVEIIYGDAMKMDLNRIIAENFSDCSSVSVCANLPYYITSPVIMKLLESRLPLKSIVVMVQKEAAKRLTAKVGTRESGAITVAVNYYAESDILFNVGRNSFMPPPNVDSAVIRLNIRKTPPVTVKDEEKFFNFVKSAFAQRRKTLVNTLANTQYADKNSVKNALAKCGLSENVRAEALCMEELSAVFNAIQI